MITEAEEKDILHKAYVPEHLVGLMTRVSGAEPFLVEDYFCLRKGDLMIVVGYPLARDHGSDKLERILNEIMKVFRPVHLSLVAPEVPQSFYRRCVERDSDYYFTLDLPHGTVRGALRRAVAKAMDNATVERSNSLGVAHQELAAEFVERVGPPRRVRELLFRMWDYVGRGTGSLVLNAWGPDHKLAAFYVLDVSAKDFSTYVIGCHSRKSCVVHASDLLFNEMIRVSEEWGKSYIHLGLGVNEGIRRFKQKWGGVPRLRYEMCELAVRKTSLLDSLIAFPGKR